MTTDADIAALADALIEHERIRNELRATTGIEHEAAEVARWVKQRIQQTDQLAELLTHARDANDVLVETGRNWRDRAEKAEAALAYQPAPDAVTEEEIAGEIFNTVFGGTSDPVITSGLESVCAASAKAIMSLISRRSVGTNPVGPTKEAQGWDRDSLADWYCNTWKGYEAEELRYEFADAIMRAFPQPGAEPINAIAEIVGSDSKVHYRVPLGDPSIDEAWRTPGYHVRLVPAALTHKEGV